MPPKSSVRVLFALVIGILFTCLAIAFIDRPASTWSYEHLHRPVVMVWLTHAVDPLQPLAIVGLAIAGLAVLLRDWQPGSAGRAFIAGCLAIMLSVAIKEQLKYLFGRTWPETWVANNPSWIHDHIYGFYLRHGGEGWASFPSGHTTQMAALATVVWLTCRPLRWLAIALVLAVVVGLWGADFHFVGDIAAGGTLGFACGIGMVELLCERPKKGGK